MPIIYSSEYCKFYPYCIHSNFKEISCKNGNWIYCYIYQKINISKVNNMKRIIIQSIEMIKCYMNDEYVLLANCCYCKLNELDNNDENYIYCRYIH